MIGQWECPRAQMPSPHGDQADGRRWWCPARTATLAHPASLEGAMKGVDATDGYGARNTEARPSSVSSQSRSARMW
jgi:hypothetical protein